MPSVIGFSLPLRSLKAAALLTKQEETAPETHTQAPRVRLCQDQSVR